MKEKQKGKPPLTSEKQKIRGKEGGQDRNPGGLVAVFKNPNSSPAEKQEALKKLEDSIYTFLEAEELELIATESADSEKRKEAVIKLFLDGHTKILKRITKSDCLYEDTKEYAFELINRRSER